MNPPKINLSINPDKELVVMTTYGLDGKILSIVSLTEDNTFELCGHLMEKAIELDHAKARKPKEG